MVNEQFIKVIGQRKPKFDDYRDALIQNGFQTSVIIEKQFRLTPTLNSIKGWVIACPLYKIKPNS